MENFAPTINLDGRTIKPKGYEWILGFALGGCDWAIKEASKPEFLEMVRADLKKEMIIRLERLIDEYEKKIAVMKDDIESYGHTE